MEISKKLGLYGPRTRNTSTKFLTHIAQCGISYSSNTYTAYHGYYSYYLDS